MGSTAQTVTTFKRFQTRKPPRSAFYLVLVRGEVNSDPWRHGFGVPKKGIEAEGELLQIFSLDVSERRLWRRQNITDRTERFHASPAETAIQFLTPMKEMIPVDLPGGGLRTQTVQEVRDLLLNVIATDNIRV